MPREELRRRAGGVGDLPTTEEDVLGTGKPAKKGGATAPKRSPQDVEKIMHPEILEFPIQRGDKSATLVVPTVFSIGDVTQRKVYEDYDAYYRLVMVELGKVSSIDLVANPTAIFADANLPYLSIALTTSNTLEFMRRVLSKSAHVVVTEEDGTEKKVRVTNDDLDQLGSAQQIAIGGNYVGRWIASWLKARDDAKNGSRAAQT